MKVLVVVFALSLAFGLGCETEQTERENALDNTINEVERVIHWIEHQRDEAIDLAKQFAEERDECLNREKNQDPHRDQNSFQF